MLYIRIFKPGKAEALVYVTGALLSHTLHSQVSSADIVLFFPMSYILNPVIATVVNYGVFSMRTMIFLAISANAEGDFFVVMLCKAGFEDG